MGCKEELLRPGSTVEIETRTGLRIKGLILPRYTIYNPRYITLKLENGYNIGIRIDNIKSVRRSVNQRRSREQGFMTSLSKAVKGKDKVLIMVTGGTIASKIDYETGGVKPIIDPEELLEAVPELGEIAEIKTEEIFSVFSEDMAPRHWRRIAERVYKHMTGDGEVNGIIVAHGTDTMAYTAAALSFAIMRPPVPVALVGSQRSSDRPSSDSAFNLVSAALYALSDIGEIAVVMHGTTSDTYALAHRGVRVRKMHTSRRDAFQSIDSLPLAKIYPYEKKIIILREDARKTGENREPVLKPYFSEKVALLKFYPGMPSWIIEEFVGRNYEGLVLEGTGLGHVSEELIETIRKAVREGVIVTMTSQCIFGTVNLNVYSKGRRLLEAGVIPAEDMIAETALVKLSWLLGNFEDHARIKELFRENLVGEIEARRPLDVYPRWNHGE